VYIPAQFREHEVPTIHAAIHAAGLATLVTFGPDGLLASPVPMLLDSEPAPYGTLLGHLARGNPQWRRTAAGVAGLALFQGPDAYVTPSWYATKRQTGEVVPTWNYVAVHAYGAIEFFDDAASLRTLVTRLTERHEGVREHPWAVADAPPPFIDAQLKGIVGFRLEIERLEGKWKMSQNRSAADRATVIAGLTTEGNTAVADLVARGNAMP
jgi:transcriptional regulator